RTLGASIGLRVPADVVEHKCASYRKRGKPAARPSLISRDDVTILNTYQTEYRGIVQYYQLAENIGWLARLHWVMQQSAVRTLANKYRLRPRVIFRRYRALIETPYGKRRCLQTVEQAAGGKKPRRAHFGGIPLRRNGHALISEYIPTPFQYHRKELIRNMRADTCMLCGTRGNCEVHQVRKLAELDHVPPDLIPRWAFLMKKRRRKTLIVCQPCHRSIHHEER
ncbi:MAG TPA: group II intron reverse transcriptase/maturase, partial [Ktedonobacteraceae bacterium]|nr:group II intron reverse transcriptase/maturase [Ktedonobacteraceae bacterium]